MKRRNWCAYTAACFLVLGICLIPIILVARSHRPSLVRPLAGEKSLATAAPKTTHAKSAVGFSNLPLSFEPNVGQTYPQVQFLAHGDAYTIYLMQGETVLAFNNNSQQDLRFTGPDGHRRLRLHRPMVKTTDSSALHLQFEGANLTARTVGLQPLPGKINYFIGNNPKNWHTGVPTFARVDYEEVYPGVDLAFYGNRRRLEYDFKVKPGADPGNIALRLKGATKLRIDGDGSLEIGTPAGEVELHKPSIYQGEGNSSSEIEGNYVVRKNGTITFAIANYDRSKPLVIDPAVDYSTYLGGSSYDYVTGTAVDSQGNAYVTGITWSLDFPTTSNAVNPGPPPSNTTNTGAAFVTEINPNGTSVLYSTYLTGNNGAFGWGIALDSANPPNVYVTGGTCSTDFPTTPNAYLPRFTPSTCFYNEGAVFAAKLNPALSGTNGLIYSTYLGGNGIDQTGAIAVDAKGNMYVTGMTSSSNFPVTQTAFQTSNKWAGAVGSTSGGDAFVSRIDPSQSGTASLIYSTYLGGSGNTTTRYGDAGQGIAVDSSANVYVAGYTDSSNFPTTASAYSQTAPGSVLNGGWAGFVSRINTNRSGAGSLIYSTFLGGSTGNANAGDSFLGVAIGPSNLLYATGSTNSQDFPVTSGSFRSTAPSGGDAVIFCVIDTTQSGSNSLSYSTYLSGGIGSTDNYDWGAAVAVDSAGNAYITGVVDSTDFPVTAGAFQTTFKNTNKGANSFVSEVVPLGNGSADLLYSTYYGGSGAVANYGGDWGYGIAIDSAHNAYVGGFTESPDFPITSGAFQTAVKGPYDSFVAKLSLTPKVLPTPSISSLSVSSGGTGTSVMISGSNFGMNQGTSTVTFGSATATVSSWDSTSIIVQVPSEGTAGSVNVVIHTSVGTSNSKSFTVLPTIVSLSPSTGPVGSSVTISGYNFGSSGTVKFNGVSATTTSWTSTTIVATVPSSATTGNVIVTSNSVSSAGVSFTVVPTPSISSLSQSSGASGTSVTISGSNFGSSQASENGLVVFNGANAFISSWSTTSIVAQVPSTASPGAGSVYVTASGVQSNSVTFTVNPSINSLSPSAGPVGQTVTVTGSDFGSPQGSSVIKFGGTTATVSSWTSTSISAVVPTLAAGAVSVTVTAGSVTTSSLWFTVTGASGTATPPNPPVPGMPPFASFGGGPDRIDLGNLNVHYDIPVLSKAGRGTPLSYTLKYDSSIYYLNGAPGSVTWQPVSNWGWAGQSSVVLGSVSYAVAIGGNCNGQSYTTYYGWSYQDRFGVSHPFNVSGVSSNASCGSNTQTGSATDGSGYSLTITAVPNTTPQAFNATVASKRGYQFNPPVNATGGAGAFTDRNGNQITVNSSGVFTDTLGTTALTVTGSAPNPVKFGYTPPAGGTVYVQVTYRTYSIHTNFGCTGVGEYTNTSVPLVDRVTYPDGTYYQFQYELTPGSTTTYTGRVASVTLPSGGTISYTYQGGNNGIMCGDGSTAGFKRYTPDTRTSSFWNYLRTPGSGAASTTTITDPTSQANKTVIQFQGIYETERQSYQGSSTLLRTISTCYNGNTSNCTSTPVGLPILQRNVTTQIAGANNLTAAHVTRYDSNQNVLEQDDYDYGAGAQGNLLKKTVFTYAALGNNITGLPQQVTTTDGGGSLVSQSTYSYDQGSVATTTGTPQHVAVTGSRGNLTSVNTYKSGSTFLTKSFTYFDTGNVQTTTDVNSAQTTYTYGACGNSFPTNISEPLSLSRSMAWNCTGGVQTSVTDENGKVWSTSYTNAFFWRPDSSTDPANAVTSLTYTGATQVESVLPIVTGSSATDALATLDSLGRPHLAQIRQSPGGTTFDTTETDYDIEGRVTRVTLPFGANAGHGSSSAPGKTTTFDALGRVTRITDGGNGYTANSYSQNDMLATRGPAPNGQNAEKHQYEYDALGRLTSVCEITSAAGGGTCAQTSPLTGYWTKYSYNAQGRLTGVTQNAQSSGSTQVRSYTYDLLGRMTSAKDPETGNLAYTYTYDTDSTCGTFNGDVVKKADPIGNVTCYSYDALHRQLSITYPSGTYASKTPSKHFVYDAATVNGVAMTNAKTKLAEAYTCVSPCTTKLTDVGVSYTVRGERSDVYESTPNSGGYYHVAEQFWANGAMKQLNGLASLPTFTFNPDGEGRIYQVSASSGQNPVTNAVFNNASLPTSVTFGSQDSDSFTYDPNTNRMTQYQFGVNGQSLTGTLTWNANSTLHGLTIADALNTADNQSCSFLYDDLARIASTDCGTVWSQTYSYDAFGNIVKNGSAPFQPTYNLATNQITSVSGFTPTYDSNGNTLTDPSHTYSWDSAGKPVAIDSVNISYDALGRMVEQNRSGAFTQFVYGPHGGKFAIFSGQTLQKAFLPLPGGAQAVYNASGVLYYGHSDHLGSVRLGSTSSRTVSFDVAYAPFGETYAASGSTDPAFTSQRQDTVSGVYDFPAREYNPQGRWPSPDPLGLASLNPLDPQSLNRYAYARNTPTSLVDPFGMESCDESTDPGGCDGWGGGGGGVIYVDVPVYVGTVTVSQDWYNQNNTVTVTPDDSTPPTVDTVTQPTGELTAPNDSLQGTILGQMADPTQCADCMSTLNAASSVVEAAGWAEIGGAALVSGGFALDALSSLASVGGELTPTLETANTYMDALGLTDNVAIAQEATFGENAAMTFQGDILLSQSAFESEGTLVQSLVEESTHLSQYAAAGGPVGGVGITSAFEAEASATARLVWGLFQASGGLP